MIVERIADGRRRFFPAPGEVRAVYLRDKRGHRDRALEPGRDYELETGGVSLVKVPAGGETVVLDIGDRVSSTKSRGEVLALDEPGNQITAPENQSASISSWTDQVLKSAIEIGSQSDQLDLETVKSVVVLAVRDTAEKTPRTAEWQDELARLTAIMWAAEDLDGVRAGLLAIEAYLGGEP